MSEMSALARVSLASCLVGWMIDGYPSLVPKRFEIGTAAVEETFTKLLA